MGGVVYPETYVDAGKFKGIDARGIGVVVRPRVVGQDFCEGLALVRRQLPLHGLGDVDGEWRLLCRFLGKAVQRIGVGVGERQVGLDVVYGRSAEHVGTADVDDGTLRRIQFDALNPYARQPDGIWPERRAGGEDSHAAVAAQPRRTYGGRPAFAVGFGEIPNDPEVAEAFQTPQCGRVAVGWGEDDGAAEAFDEAALARYAELRAEVGEDVGDGVHGCGGCGAGCRVRAGGCGGGGGEYAKRRLQPLTPMCAEWGGCNRLLSN